MYISINSVIINYNFPIWSSKGAEYLHEKRHVRVDDD